MNIPQALISGFFSLPGVKKAYEEAQRYHSQGTDIKKILAEKGITSADITNRMLPILHSENIVSNTLKKLGGQELINQLDSYGSQVAKNIGQGNASGPSNTQQNVAFNGGNQFPPLKSNR